MSNRNIANRFIATTLTGVDAQTPMHDVLALMRHPHVELAFLYSLDSCAPRFVNEAWLRGTIARTHGCKARLAIHVCGSRARQQLLGGGLSHLMPYVSRVQVNGTIDTEELPRLAPCVPQLITQHTPSNASLVAVPLSTHSLLVDESGGTGRLPTTWVRPQTGKAVGFAGGLNLNNLAGQLQRIASVARGTWWIDLESGLRTPQDLFCAPTAFGILDVAETFRTARA